MSTQRQTARALLVEAIEKKPTQFPDIKPWVAKATNALEIALGEEAAAVKRFEAVDYRIRSNLLSADQARAKWAGAIRTAVAILEGALIKLDAEADPGPHEGLDALHPWVAAAASELHGDGYHRAAVKDAATAVEHELRTKLGVAGSTGSRLIAQAFGSDAPKPGQARLRFPGYVEGSDSWTDAHTGALHFGQGYFMRIRNLYSHDIDPVTEAEALEALGAFSLLARWIDEAVLEQARE